MKLGIELDWQKAKFHMPIERIKLADRLGYDAVFTAEANGSDGLTPLAYVLGITERIGVGTHIAQTVGRSPVALAMAFQTMRHIGGAEREIVAGLGSASVAQAEAWHGQPWTPPYHRMKDWVAIMRKAFNGEVVEHSGKIISVPYRGSDAQGTEAPMKPILETDPKIPIVFGGTSELMLTLAAEIADGWMPMMYSPDIRDKYFELIKTGFAKRKNPPKLEDFPIWTHVDVLPTDDVKEAMRQFKNYTARWGGGWNPSGKQLNPFATYMHWRGYGEIQERLQELYLAGHEEEAANAVPDEFIDEGGWLFGSMDRILERWKRDFVDKGINFIVRTDNWPIAERSGDMVYEPIYRAARG